MSKNCNIYIVEMGTYIFLVIPNDTMTNTSYLNYDNKNENLRQFDLKNSIDLRNDGVSQININNVSAAARSLTRGVCK